jgi:hypothetical protein
LSRELAPSCAKSFINIFYLTLLNSKKFFDVIDLKFKGRKQTGPFASADAKEIQVRAATFSNENQGTGRGDAVGAPPDSMVVTWQQRDKDTVGDKLARSSGPFWVHTLFGNKDPSSSETKKKGNVASLPVSNYIYIYKVGFAWFVEIE